jgi:carboxyl-terminal processing protease
VERPKEGVSRSEKTPRRKSFKGLLKTSLNIALLVGIFWLGMNVGNGTFNLASNSSTAANQGLPADLDYSEVERVYDILRENYDGKLTVEELINGMKSGLIGSAGDPYTEYFNAEDAQAFNEQLSGTFSGIGAELGKDDNDNLIIVAPINGFPAQKAGLRPQDSIISIDGDSTAGMSIIEAVSKIRGKEGTDVTLGVVRGGDRKLEITITRENITIPSVEHEIKEGNIGYIQMNQFWTDTAALTRQAAHDFKRQNVQKVILDLRGNPGGSLEAAVDVASVWLPSGKTVLEERRDGKIIRVYKSSGTASLQGVETVVLIDEGSASASEIVAGALKDNGVATLVGQQSYGKGSVQQIIGLRDGGELKVTIARWHRPNGENIDKKGIKPDQKVAYTEDDAKANKDPQLEAAIKRLK